LNQVAQKDSSQYDAIKYLTLAFYASKDNSNACEHYNKFKKLYGEIKEFEKIKCYKK
jgi:hypothetical protein